MKELSLDEISARTIDVTNVKTSEDLRAAVEIMGNFGYVILTGLGSTSKVTPFLGTVTSSLSVTSGGQVLMHNHHDVVSDIAMIVCDNPGYRPVDSLVVDGRQVYEHMKGLPEESEAKTVLGRMFYTDGEDRIRFKYDNRDQSNEEVKRIIESYAQRFPLAKGAGYMTINSWTLHGRMSCHRNNNRQVTAVDLRYSDDASANFGLQRGFQASTS